MSQLHLTLKPKASAVFADPARFVMATCGRRFGKSYLAVAKALKVALEKPRANVLMLAPTHEMAKATLWRSLTDLVPESWISKRLDSTLELHLINGSRIECKSGDRPDRLRGRSLDFVCLDEAAYLQAPLWFEVLRPALSDRQGGALFTTTPAGLVQSWFADLWEATDDGWGRHQYSTLQGGWVSDSEVAEARAMLDPRTFRAEYEASFEAPTGRVFPDFGEENIDDTIGDDGFDGLKIGIDFNVATLPAIVCRVVGDELWVIDEVTLHNSTTEQLGRTLRERFPDRNLLAYPDPTGGARKTSAAAGATDHTLLEKSGIRVYERRTPYAIRDKYQAMNWLICDARGRRRLRVHPQCRDLIRDLKFMVYKEGTDQPDKSDPERSHHSDALGYAVLGAMKPLMPMKYQSRWSSLQLW